MPNFPRDPNQPSPLARSISREVNRLRAEDGEAPLASVSKRIPPRVVTQAQASELRAMFTMPDSTGEVTPVPEWPS